MDADHHRPDVTAAGRARAAAQAPTVAVIGCGWLGTPLATRLIERGSVVFGTTTRAGKLPALAALGIRAVMFDLNHDPQVVPVASAYVITIPPSGITGYAGKVAALVEAIDAAARPVVFCSSTSVYPDEARTMVESDVLPGEVPAAGEADAAPHGTRRGELLAAEGACARHAGHVILRLGGLYGAGRHPVTFLAGRTGVPRPLAPVNVVHLDDVVAVVMAILDRRVAGEVFNVCSDRLRTREAFYTAAARELGLPAPVFDASDPSGGKRVDSGKLVRDLGFRFSR